MGSRSIRPPSSLPRRSALFMVLWAFGFSTTLLMIGLWGRATSGDEATLVESAEAALTAEELSDRLYDWVGAGLSAAEEIDGEVVRSALIEIEEHPEAQRAIDSLVAQAVAALFAKSGTSREIEVTETLGPLVPLLSTELADRGVEVPAAMVREQMARVGEIDLGGGVTGGIAGLAEDVHAILTWVVLLAVAGLVISAMLALALAADRRAMARNLATRVALSAGSFFVLFQIGGWILAPDGGRSPVRSGGAALVRSNGHVFLIVALVAGVIAGLTLIFWSNRQARSDSDVDLDDTRELVSV